MNLSIHRDGEAVRQLVLIAVGAAEAAHLRRLVDQMLKGQSLTLDAGEVALMIGPFAEGHVDRLEEVGPSPMLETFRAITTRDPEAKP